MNIKGYVQQAVKKVAQLVTWLVGLCLRELIREYVIPYVKEIFWSFFDE
ncbi:hypothetical protein SAMN05216522_1238 [Rosenbergiella nectarea]|uniref:Uncharacterized protein n=1 Tax=Rosenbergiella nectarea TaxID=988801 RepID=A0A1H9N5K1_9GAMM|nr:hypothetical protein [Rosenbergiella nectarea]SER30925.1 hypothetical protein SAMN05216522_1238 [Rosenbergiella nectarea]